MGKYIISIQAFESIIKNLVRLEEERKILTDQFFLEPTTERSERIQLLEQYIEQMDQLLSVIDKNITSDRSLPFVAIGCVIEVEDVFNRIRHEFRLVSPFEEGIQFGDVSIFSPLGKALLLKKVGSIIKLNTSAGKVKYKITRINL